jgi:hypothetical protein
MLRAGYRDGGSTLPYDPPLEGSYPLEELLLLGGAKVVASSGKYLFRVLTTDGTPVVVTTWVQNGVIADLAVGRWVVEGEATVWNFIKTRLWGGRYDAGIGFSGPKAMSQFTPLTGTASTQFPDGASWFRGLFGQRVVAPKQ